MDANSTRVFAASWLRTMAMIALSLAGVAFGATMYSLVPEGAARTAFLVIPIVAAVSTLLSVWRTRLSWRQGVVRYQRLFGSWSVNATDIESWKLHSPISRSTALEVRTRQGRKLQVPDVSALSITDHEAFARDFAALIAGAKATVRRIA